MTAFVYIAHSSDVVCCLAGVLFSIKCLNTLRVCLGVRSLCIRITPQADASASKRTEQSSKADAAEVIHSQEWSSDTSDEGKQTRHMPSSFSLEKYLRQ